MTENISVIIPVFNEEKVISSCLGSLLKQSLPAKEIIVVDDGSTDQTVSIVKNYPVRLLHQDHQGPGAARNKGARSASGGILVFVDADMTFAPDFLDKLTKPLRDGKQKGVFNLDERVSNIENPWANCWQINQNLSGPNRFNPKSRHDTMDFRAILKKEFDAVGGFSTEGYTDSRSLVPKLGYKPAPVGGAISYHQNPETLREVFLQARWIGKRPMRWGIIGKFLNLVRYSLPASLILGLTKSVTYRQPLFLVFKLVYDLGFFVGIWQSLLFKKTAK